MSPLEIREHRTALAIVALFMVFAFGAAGLVVFASAESASSETGAAVAPGAEAAPDCPRGEPQGFALSDIEGKTMPEAEAWAASMDWTVRPVMIDGQPQATTMDFREDRVNVQLEEDVVTRYCGNY